MDAVLLAGYGLGDEMALVLKSDKTFTDAFGNTGSNYYMVIDRFDLDKSVQRCVVHLANYANKQAREDGLRSVERFDITIIKDAYTQYLAKDKIADINIYTAIYTAAINHKVKSNDPDGDDVLLLADWESDEVE